MNHDLIARLLDGEAIQAIAPILALTGGVIKALEQHTAMNELVGTLRRQWVGDV